MRSKRNDIQSRIIVGQTLHIQTLLLVIFLFLFSYYFTEIDMYEHFEDCIHGARLYILNETDDTLPAAKRHMKMYVSFDLSAIGSLFIFFHSIFVLFCLFRL